MARPGTPAGSETVATFLFSDIEGSTRRWEDDRGAMAADLARHDEILRHAVEAAGGELFSHTGDGACAVFPTAAAAVAAARAAQQALAGAAWAAPAPLRVRMAVHTGPAQQRAANWFGPTLNRAARLMAAAWGGQVVCSRATSDALDREHATDVELLDLGEHRLADLSRPEHIFQVVHPDLPRAFPPLRSLGRHRHNLPVAINSFLGRAAELAEIADLISRSRLITVLGVGGAGKTRLALQAAADAVEQFPGGVWLVGLAAVRDPELIGPAVARALGVEIAGLSTKEEVFTRLADSLHGKRALLVLDNCEHVIAGAAEAVHQLLERSPELVVLATSQEVLAVPGENVWRIPSLSLPEAGETDLTTLERSDAVAIFVDRAAAARPGFALTTDVAADVAAICRRLDGIPLAVELAAARVPTLGVRGVADRLDRCFAVLGGGARTVSRHQTLRAALDWSHDLLSPEERAGLRRLNVFATWFTLEAAEQVIGADTAEVVLDPVDALLRLSDKSLVMIGDDGTGAVRYRLLQPIRQYARQKLVEAGEEHELLRRHRDYFLEMFHRFGTWADEWPSTRRLIGVAGWRDDLRAALGWSLDQEEFEAALGLVTAIWQWWFFDGEPGAAARLQSVLERTPAVRTDVRFEALLGLAALSDDPASAAAAFEDAAELAESLGNVHLSAIVGFLRGEHALAGGDAAAAGEWLRRALPGFEAVGNRPGAGMCEYQLGWVAVAEGELRAARAHFEAAVSLDEHAAFLAAHALSALGPLLTLLGDREAGLAAAARARDVAARVPLRLMTVMALVRSAEAALLTGDTARARTVLGGALTRIGDMATTRYLADCLEVAGIISAIEGRREAAGLMFAACADIGAGYGASGARFVAALSRQWRATVDADPAVAEYVHNTAGPRPIAAARAVALAQAALAD
jgi:predicted ATPase/class 3 adenylate cyclase